MRNDVILLILAVIYFCIGFLTYHATTLKKAHIKFISTELYQKYPTRATKGSAGHDFYAPKLISIPPKEIAIVDTNIKTKIPEGYVLQLFMRSSMGIKNHLMLANTVGIIDSDYDETIKAVLYNYGDEEVIIRPYDRFMQGICVPYITTEQPPVSLTRKGGIGSTGR